MSITVTAFVFICLWVLFSRFIPESEKVGFANGVAANQASGYLAPLVTAGIWLYSHYMFP